MEELALGSLLPGAGADAGQTGLVSHARFELLPHPMKLAPPQPAPKHPSKLGPQASC